MLNMLFLAAMTSNVGSIREDLILQKIYDANNKILLFFSCMRYGICAG